MAGIALAIFIGVAVTAASSWAEEGKGAKGKELFLQYKCNSCHTVKAQAIEKKGAEEAQAETKEAADTKHKPPDLSGAGVDRDAAWLSKWLLKQQAVEGRYHKKKFRGTDAELKTVTGWLETLKTDEAGKPKKASAKAEKAEPAVKTEAAQKAEPAKPAEPAQPAGPAEKADPAPAEKSEGAK